MKKRKQKTQDKPKPWKQPNYAGKNLRLGNIQASEVETFRTARMSGRTRNRLEHPPDRPPMVEVFIQCWNRKCLSVATVETDRPENSLTCPYCQSPAEKLTVAGKPV